MSAHRFFLTAPLASEGEQRLALSDADVHHAVDVLRVRPGEIIDVVDPDSRAWSVRVGECGPGGISAIVVEEIPSATRTHVTLFQGVAKGEKMDTIIRQAVEIGAAEIVPVLFERSIVRLGAEKGARRAERWRRIAEAAAKQSKRERVPTVAEPISAAEACERIAKLDGAVVLWEECEEPSVEEAVRAIHAFGDSRIALVVGPEGGLTAEEVAALEAVGGRVASLGPTILRTETAAMVALALAVSALGGLGNARG